MPYSASVYGVMIASPSDCEQERRVAKNVIEDWNASNSQYRKIVLEPRMWESHSFPEIGDRPQGLINKQVLKNSDLLIAIFWTRLGTPTGEVASGTVEEIEEHIALGKPALIYFSSIPVAPEVIDQEQFSSLKEFKESIKDRALIASYGSYEDFRNIFSRNLAKIANERFYGPSDSELVEPLGSFVSERSVDTPGLTDDAKSLLAEATKDSSGTVMMLNFLGGSLLQTNGKNFIQDKHPKVRARWKSALDELRNENCLEDKGYKGEVFGVTHFGYEVARILGL